MNEPERSIQDRSQDLTRDFATITKTEIIQIKNNGKSTTIALRDSLTFLDLLRDDFNRMIENEKNDLLQTRKAKMELKN